MPEFISATADIRGEYRYPARVARALALLPRLHALGVTKDGHPRHPLYVPADAPLIEWMP